MRTTDSIIRSIGRVTSPLISLEVLSEEFVHDSLGPVAVSHG